MKIVLISFAFLLITTGTFAQQVSTDTLHWSATRKLDWKDFEKKTGKTGMTGHAVMVMNATFRKGLKATTSVVAVFDRNSSFAAPNEKTAQMLRYYQVLFDLYEAESRKLRKVFKETKLGLDPEKTFQEKYTAAQKALDERAEQYIEETENGEKADEIEKWSKMLQLELKEMEAFSK